LRNINRRFNKECLIKPIFFKKLNVIDTVNSLENNSCYNRAINGYKRDSKTHLSVSENPAINSEIPHTKSRLGEDREKTSLP
jgi:hypothetical protein